MSCIYLNSLSDDVDITAVMIRLLLTHDFFVVVEKLPDVKEMLDFVVNAPCTVNRLTLSTS